MQLVLTDAEKLALNLDMDELTRHFADIKNAFGCGDVESLVSIDGGDAYDYSELRGYVEDVRRAVDNLGDTTVAGFSSALADVSAELKYVEDEVESLNTNGNGSQPEIRFDGLDWRVEAMREAIRGIESLVEDAQGKANTDEVSVETAAPASEQEITVETVRRVLHALADEAEQDGSIMVSIDWVRNWAESRVLDRLARVPVEAA